MASIVNDRDLLLQGATDRVIQSTTNGILAQYSAPKFSVNAGISTPSTITITYILLGSVAGVATYSIISGASSIDTTTVPKAAILSYSSLTADIAVIRISINFRGTLYTTECKIEGKVTSPGTTGTLVATPEYEKIKLSWPRNPEADIKGYEVRDTDPSISTTTGWGSTSYLYHGGSTECTVPPGLLNVAKTWYVRAYDDSNLFSTTSSSISYTVVRPPVVTGISAAFESNSNTNFSVNVAWTPNPSVFKAKSYRVRVVSTTPIADINYTTASTNLNIPITWEGNASIYVYVTDFLNNESLASIPIVISKNTPGIPISPLLVPAGSQLQASWTPPNKTTLPIAGYEIRRNTSWGMSDPANFVWRGDANSIYIPQPVVGTNIYYVATFDTNNTYSVGTTMSYTVLPPGAATLLEPGYTYTATSTTTATVKVSWIAPSTTSFPVSKYRIEYTRPNYALEILYTSDTSMILQADWVGDAYFKIFTIDVANIESISTVIVTIPKALPRNIGTVAFNPNGTNMRLSWDPIAPTTLPIIAYEIRLVDANWGTILPPPLWKGYGHYLDVPFSTSNLGDNNFYIKALDTDGRYSSISTNVNALVVKPVAPFNVEHFFTDTSLTAATITISWSNVTPQFTLAGYEISYNYIKNSVPIDVVEFINSTTITFPANWIGNRDFSIRTRDVLGNYSDPIVVPITKLIPNPVNSVRAQVIDNSVLLYWSMPTKTSLPLSHVFIRKEDSLGYSSVIGDKTGTFTSVFELAADTYTYYITAVDTDNNYSIETSTTASVSQPPDYIFNASYSSNFQAPSSILNSAVVDTENNVRSIVLPINTSETVASHFTSSAWSSPQDQVTAGYPIFIQPGTLTGYYEETFDYGNLLATSQVTLSLGGASISGTPSIIIYISVSADNVNYIEYSGVSSVYVSNFRWVRIRVKVTQNIAGDLYKINSLVVRLDAKELAYSSSTNAVSTDTLGTIVNFGRDFVDVNLISLTPANGTAKFTALYDFRDYVIIGSYTVNTNICRIITTAHGLVVGQNVRLYFTSGNALPGTYTITAVIDANTFEVSMVIGNTSGSVTTYPAGMRVYLYDTLGVRQSGKVSWSIKGY